MDKKLITYKNNTISYKEFDELIKKIINKFNSFDGIDDFVIINEENPINFYIIFFALLECNKKIVLPNRDFFSGENFKFVKYIIQIDKITPNINYKKIKNIEGDIVVFSSGSTGKPKGIVHKKDDFFINAKYVSQRLDIDNITSITPLKPYLVSALSHFLVHKMTNSHLIFIDTDNIKEVENYSNIYEDLSYVGSPMHILSMMPFINNRNPNIFFSSGDIFYPSAIEDIITKYPTTRFFNVYGMAELGGRIFINKIDKNTDKKFYKSIGRNIDIIDIKIDNDKVFVKSDILFFGYIIDNVFYQRDEGYFDTGDKVIEKNGVFEFYGRSNDEIKVAGNKVSLKYIEQQIATILDDRLTPIVVTEKHQLLGNLIVLVLYGDLELSRIDILKQLRKNMNSYELPHKIYKIKEIPYTQTMKIDRKQIINNLNELELLK